MLPASMDGRKLCFFLFLCHETEAGSPVRITQPYVVPICPSATLHAVTLIVCKISRGSGECRLLYRHGYDFVNGCDPGFALATENRTVSLRLDNLTSGESGRCTCECSHAGGTFTLNLNFTVGGDEEDATFPVKTLVSGCVIAVTVSGVVIGLVLRKYKNNREDIKSGPSGLPSCSMDVDDPDDPYTPLRRPPRDLYQTISSVHHQHSKMKLEIDRKEADQDGCIYEIL